LKLCNRLEVCYLPELVRSLIVHSTCVPVLVAALDR